HAVQRQPPDSTQDMRRVNSDAAHINLETEILPRVIFSGERLRMNRIRDNIDKLIDAEAANSERLVRFFELVQSNYDESIRAATRFFLLMMAAWFLAYAIDRDWTEEISFFGLKLNRKMIVVSPFLVGVFSYG